MLACISIVSRWPFLDTFLKVCRDLLRFSQHFPPAGRSGGAPSAVRVAASDWRLVATVAPCCARFCKICFSCPSDTRQDRGYGTLSCGC